MPHEIITLQLGNYSNFIGSHFWNIQEKNFVFDSTKTQNLPDINNDVLFREGLNLENRVTYTPRLILVDLRDSQSSLKQSGTLYDNKEHELAHPSWTGKIEIHKSEPREPLDLIRGVEETIEVEIGEHENQDEKVKHWADYLTTPLHPRSTLLIDEFMNQNSENEPFELYHYGVNAMKNEDYAETFENRLRSYAEECDYMQGFHLFLDAYNGFGGLTEKILSLINDEYSKRTVMSFLGLPHFENQTNATRTVKLINTSFALKTLFTDVSDAVVVPMSCLSSFLMDKTEKPVNLDFIDYKVNLNYHTSAILASLIDSISIPWRQRSQNTKLSDIYDSLNVYKHKLCAVKAQLPFNMEKHPFLFDYLQQHNLNEKLNWFTPLCDNRPVDADNQEFISQIITCKGIADAKVKNPRDTYAFKSVIPASELLDVYCGDSYSNAISKCFSLQTPLDVTPPPFPHIFQQEFRSSHGSKVPLVTSLQATNRMSNMLASMHGTLEKCNIREYNHYLDSGMEFDDFKETLDFNTELYYQYASKL